MLSLVGTYNVMQVYNEIFNLVSILYMYMYMYLHLGISLHTQLDALSVMLDSKSTTSLTISWTLFGTATGYTISYSNTNNTDCITAGYPDIPISASESGRELMGLEEGTEYSITVTATLSGGGTGEDSLTATTMAAG